MAAPKGNNYWTLRTTDGRDFEYSSPDELWAECVSYFEWVQSNPLKEQKAFHTNGQITKTNVTKMRAMTISGLCLFLGICEKTWANYRDRKDFLQVTTRAEKIIYTQKFEGAAADLLNPNIIARDLGLTDKSDVKTEIRITRKIHAGDSN